MQPHGPMSLQSYVPGVAANAVLPDSASTSHTSTPTALQSATRDPADQFSAALAQQALHAAQPPLAQHAGATSSHAVSPMRSRLGSRSVNGVLQDSCAQTVSWQPAISHATARQHEQHAGCSHSPALQGAFVAAESSQSVGGGLLWVQHQGSGSWLPAAASTSGSAAAAAAAAAVQGPTPTHSTAAEGATSAAVQAAAASNLQGDSSRQVPALTPTPAPAALLAKTPANSSAHSAASLTGSILSAVQSATDGVLSHRLAWRDSDSDSWEDAETALGSQQSAAPLAGPAANIEQQLMGPLAIAVWGQTQQAEQQPIGVDAAALELGAGQTAFDERTAIGGDSDSMPDLNDPDGSDAVSHNPQDTDHLPDMIDSQDSEQLPDLDDANESEQLPPADLDQLPDLVDPSPAESDDDDDRWEDAESMPDLVGSQLSDLVDYPNLHQYAVPARSMQGLQMSGIIRVAPPPAAITPHQLPAGWMPTTAQSAAYMHPGGADASMHSRVDSYRRLPALIDADSPGSSRDIAVADEVQPFGNDTDRWRHGQPAGGASGGGETSRAHSISIGHQGSSRLSSSSSMMSPLVDAIDASLLRLQPQGRGVTTAAHLQSRASAPFSAAAGAGGSISSVAAQAERDTWLAGQAWHTAALGPSQQQIAAELLLQDDLPELEDLPSANGWILRSTGGGSSNAAAAADSNGVVSEDLDSMLLRLALARSVMDYGPNGQHQLHSQQQQRHQGPHQQVQQAYAATVMGRNSVAGSNRQGTAMQTGLASLRVLDPQPSVAVLDGSPDAQRTALLRQLLGNPQHTQQSLLARQSDWSPQTPRDMELFRHFDRTAETTHLLQAQSMRFQQQQQQQRPGMVPQSQPAATVQQRQPQQRWWQQQQQQVQQAVRQQPQRSHHQQQQQPRNALTAIDSDDDLDELGELLGLPPAAVAAARVPGASQGATAPSSGQFIQSRLLGHGYGSEQSTGQSAASVGFGEEANAALAALWDDRIRDGNAGLHGDTDRRLQTVWQDAAWDIPPLIDAPELNWPDDQQGWGPGLAPPAATIQGDPGLQGWQQQQQQEQQQQQRLLLPMWGAAVIGQRAGIDHNHMDGAFQEAQEYRRHYEAQWQQQQQLQGEQWDQRRQQQQHMGQLPGSGARVRMIPTLMPPALTASLAAEAAAVATGPSAAAAAGPSGSAARSRAGLARSSSRSDGSSGGDFSSAVPHGSYLHMQERLVAEAFGGSEGYSNNAAAAAAGAEAAAAAGSGTGGSQIAGQAAELRAAVMGNLEQLRSTLTDLTAQVEFQAASQRQAQTGFRGFTNRAAASNNSSIAQGFREFITQDALQQMLRVSERLGVRAEGLLASSGGGVLMSYEQLVGLEDVKVVVPAHVLQRLQRRYVQPRQPGGGGSSSDNGKEGTAAAVEEDKCVICTICQCHLAGLEVVLQLPCKHDFHEACVTQWLSKYSKKCPVCKAEVS